MRRLLIILALLVCASTLAQESACQAIVQAALESIGERCGDMARGSLCMVHPPLETHPPQPDTLAQLETVSAGGLDVDKGAWGAALIHVGANLPQTYAGAGVLALLAGDAQITNQVAAEDTRAIPEPLSSATLDDATLYRLPGILPAPVGELARDELVLVDAHDLSGQWLRVVNEGEVAWVRAAMVVRLQAMEALPRIAINQPYPLQAFSLSTGSAFPACVEAEPMVAVQTPDDVAVNLTVNGVDIHVGSMVSFQQAHRGALSLTVHRGAVTTVYGQRIEAGQSAIGILAPGDDRAAQTVTWSGALPASKAETTRGERAQAAFNRLAEVNGWDAGETVGYSERVQHVVKRGESIYSIAREYQASVYAIITANPHVDPGLVFAGTKLDIPNAGSGFKPYARSGGG